MIHGPRVVLTRRRPEAGSEKSACLYVTTFFSFVRPTASRIAFSTGGLTTAAISASAPARTRSGRTTWGRRVAGSRSSKAARTSIHARRSAPSSSGGWIRRSARRRSASVIVLLRELVVQPVEPAPQARVHRSAREVEDVCDLAGRVLEQVAQHDHGAMLRGEPGERLRHWLRQGIGGRHGRRRAFGE